MGYTPRSPTSARYACIRTVTITIVAFVSRDDRSSNDTAGKEVRNGDSRGGITASGRAGRGNCGWASTGSAYCDSGASTGSSSLARLNSEPGAVSNPGIDVFPTLRKCSQGGNTPKPSAGYGAGARKVFPAPSPVAPGNAGTTVALRRAVSQGAWRAPSSSGASCR